MCEDWGEAVSRFLIRTRQSENEKKSSRSEEKTRPSTRVLRCRACEDGVLWTKGGEGLPAAPPTSNS